MTRPTPVDPRHALAAHEALLDWLRAHAADNKREMVRTLDTLAALGDALLEAEAKR